ncbi:Ap4A phosphorylase-like protein II [Trichodelitschia bisporula]|uniref:Ap4A phosphorylase-like protein II n=1 Tax=Trichodelitschia bisporula TaxID=703511 RepID=A0A6G1HTP3_9PEZI|nr:Ap4A phosphorylase-like protein II [Trichodelitschia bisporula]
MASLRLGLTQPLPVLVEARYRAAKSASSLIFSPTELTAIRTNSGVPVGAPHNDSGLFQLRYCPALGKKPTPQSDSSPKKIDPFENPDKDLFITDVPKADPTHFLILNKFPVIAQHFIIATKLNKPQTRVLEEDDLDLTYACLQAWSEQEAEGKSGKLFAFFNSGEHSGASQPHRHIQFLPVERMVGSEAAPKWQPLLDMIAASKDPSELKLPFFYAWQPIPPDPTPEELHDLYLCLYAESAAAVRKYIRSNPGDLSLHDSEDGASPFSYNLGMTTDAMIMCPRRREGKVLQSDNGAELGFAGLNGTLLAGTLMVKWQEEWELLKSKPSVLDDVLEAIGVPTAGI